ncbi:unnamed protein product [Symbiodinium necroappetens]|uniref:PH domain-containing protein n=1 Tax=Symbiodinium necroappetens TaxID=1628268 RepID=A0A812RNP6_9DINO|nr:unnamed protein product [Symbiodinium necroappetens]
MTDIEASVINTLCRCKQGENKKGEDGKAHPHMPGETDVEYFLCGEPPEEPLPPEEVPQLPSRPREGLITYSAEMDLPLTEPPMRSGEVWHLCQEDGKSFEKVILSIHSNGFSIRYPDDNHPAMSIAWSPFSLVQACRLHTIQADQSQPWLRLFKVSVFHHGITHFFATHGPGADTERARWVADVSRALRILTQSLFPSFQLAVFPLPGASWTSTRLLAGYMLLYDDQGVSLVYGELHAHCDNTAGFAAYEDDACKVQVVHLAIDTNTCVSERVGIDCSCFSLGDHHFSTRTCAEKMLWLRAISNVKVKLRHLAATPTPNELRFYRAAVREQINSLPPSPEAEQPSPQAALLPRRRATLSQLPRTGPVQALPLVSTAVSVMAKQPDSGGATPNTSPTTPNGTATGPNCYVSQPLPLLKEGGSDGNELPLPLELPRSTRVALGEVGGHQLAGFGAKAPSAASKAVHANSPS